MEKFIKERLLHRLPPRLRSAAATTPTTTETCNVLQLRVHELIKSSLQWLPHRQRGPSCGLAALSMAIQTINGRSSISILDPLLIIAQNLGVSKQGEIFAAEWLATVGQQYCKTVTTTAPIEFEVVEWQSVQQLTDEWLAKDPGGVVAVLAPYDSDGNYEPCRKTGFSAHWALLAGLVYTDSSSISIGRNMNDPHVLAFHGNSAHPGIWSAHALLKSNHQLRNVRPSVLAEAKSTGGYILPAPNGHELSALCGKVVLVKHL